MKSQHLLLSGGACTYDYTHVDIACINVVTLIAFHCIQNHSIIIICIRGKRANLLLWIALMVCRNNDGNSQAEMLAKRFFILFSELLAMNIDFPSPSMSDYIVKCH